MRAVRNGSSVEGEVGQILRHAVSVEAAPASLGSRLRKRFADIGLREEIVELRRQKPRSADAA